jgi:hypothetical protein
MRKDDTFSVVIQMLNKFNCSYGFRICKVGNYLLVTYLVEEVLDQQGHAVVVPVPVHKDNLHHQQLTV